jgi:hypothetical protein
VGCTCPRIAGVDAAGFCNLFLALFLIRFFEEVGCEMSNVGFGGQSATKQLNQLW